MINAISLTLNIISYHQYNRMVEDKVGHNSTYISLHLLDELDYCLGGYGKPSIEFLFSLNTFVESFIASSEFYTSLDELMHLNLTAPALFPNGRPILNLVVRECGLKFVNGIVDNPKQEIYRGHSSEGNKKQAQRDFIIEYGKQIPSRYFIMSNIDKPVDKIPLITSAFEDEDFVVSESLCTSAELVSNLINVCHSSSIQTSIPIYLYDKQIKSLFRTSYSIQSLERVANMYEANLEELKASLNYQYLPIPPFTNILLSQVTSVADIPQKLSQLRADFHDLREKFVALEQEISGAITYKEQLEAFKKFKDYWGAFNRKYADKKNRIFYGSIDVLKEGELDKATESIIDGGSFSEGLKDANAGKMAVSVLKKGYNWYKDRKIINRFKGLTNIWELFHNSNSLTHQLKHFERLFSVNFNNAEMNRVHSFVKNKLTDITTKID